MGNSDRVPPRAGQTRTPTRSSLCALAASRDRRASPERALRRALPNALDGSFVEIASTVVGRAEINQQTPLDCSQRIARVCVVVVPKLALRVRRAALELRAVPQ